MTPAPPCAGLFSLTKSGRPNGRRQAATRLQAISSPLRVFLKFYCRGDSRIARFCSRCAFIFGMPRTPSPTVKYFILSVGATIGRPPLFAIIARSRTVEDVVPYRLKFCFFKNSTAGCIVSRKTSYCIVGCGVL